MSREIAKGPADYSLPSPASFLRTAKTVKGKIKPHTNKDLTGGRLGLAMRALRLEERQLFRGM